MLKPWSSARARLVASYSYTAISLITSLLSVPIFLRFLGQNLFGAWIVATTVSSYFLVLNFGIAQATANRVAEAHHKRNDNEATAFLAAGFWTYARLIAPPVAVSTLVLALAAATGAPTVLTLSVLCATLFLTELPLTVFGACARSMGAVTEYQVIGSAQQILRLTASVVVLEMGGGVFGLVIALSLSNYIVYATMWFALKRVLPMASVRSARVESDVRQSLRKPSAGFFAVQLSGIVVFALDPLVILVRLSSMAVAPYAVAQRLLITASGVSSASASAFGPDMLKHKAQRSKQLYSAYERGALISAIVGASILGPLAAFGLPAIRHWVGAANTVSPATFATLLAIYAVQVMLFPLDVLLISTSEHRKYARAVLFEAFVNLSLSLALARPLGLVGVAAATLFARVVFAAPVMLRHAGRVLGVGLREVLAGPRTVASPTFLSFCVAVGGRIAFGTEIGPIIAASVAATAVYSLTVMPALKRGLSGIRGANG